MCVDVIDPACLFARQPRRVEIVHIARLRVEHVEDIDHDVHTRCEVIPELCVDQARRLRSDAVVLDERPRSEVAKANAAEDIPDPVCRQPG